MPIFKQKMKWPDATRQNAIAMLLIGLIDKRQKHVLFRLDDGTPCRLIVIVLNIDARIIENELRHGAYSHGGVSIA